MRRSYWAVSPHELWSKWRKRDKALSDGWFGYFIFQRGTCRAIRVAEFLAPVYPHLNGQHIRHMLLSCLHFQHRIIINGPHRLFTSVFNTVLVSFIFTWAPCASSFHGFTSVDIRCRCGGQSVDRKLVPFFMFLHDTHTHTQAHIIRYFQGKHTAFKINKLVVEQNVMSFVVFVVRIPSLTSDLSPQPPSPTWGGGGAAFDWKSSSGLRVSLSFVVSPPPHPPPHRSHCLICSSCFLQDNCSKNSGNSQEEVDFDDNSHNSLEPRGWLMLLCVS